MRITVIIVLSIAMSILLPASALAHEKGHIRGCNTTTCDKRVLRRAHANTVKHWKKVVAPLDSYLTSIAICESGSNPPNWSINTGNSFYGGMQFTASSWWSVGGKGYAHQASPLEQKFRAVLLSHIQGWGAWPICSHR